MLVCLYMLMSGNCMCVYVYLYHVYLHVRVCVHARFWMYFVEVYVFTCVYVSKLCPNSQWSAVYLSVCISKNTSDIYIYLLYG